jgi:2'-5' RNA ligase
VRATVHNRVLRAAEARARDLEDKMVAVLEPLLVRAGEDAAAGFRRFVTDTLTAGARRRDNALLAAAGVDGARELLASLSLTAAPGVTPASTMVALYPRPEEAAGLASGGGEPAGVLHVTLAYLGPTDEEKLAAALELVRAVAVNHAPLAGVVGGVGSFADNGNGRPLIALPDVPGLVELRHAVCTALAGLEDGGFSRDHGYTAHVTLDYTGEDELMPPLSHLGAPLHFDAIHLVRGDESVGVFPLVGVPPLTAAVGDPPHWAAPAPVEVLDVARLVGRLRTKTDPVRLAVVETVARPVLEHAGLSFDVENPFIARALATTASQITHIATTTQLDVMRVVRASYEQGLSIPDTAKAIQAHMAEAAPARARLIARTELAGAVNGGSLAATQIVASATGTGYLKTWLTGGGARHPRHETYPGLDGQTVELDGYFDVGDTQLSYPGDPDGPPDEVCNCRCTMTYVDAAGNETDADIE